MARSVVPIFRKQKWGRVINVSTSILTMMRKGFVPYGPTKAVLEAWSLILSRQLEGSGITVNVVLPGGPVDTAMVLGDDRSALISPDVMSAVTAAPASVNRPSIGAWPQLAKPPRHDEEARDGCTRMALRPYDAKFWIT